MEQTFLYVGHMRLLLLYIFPLVVPFGVYGNNFFAYGNRSTVFFCWSTVSSYCHKR